MERGPTHLGSTSLTTCGSGTTCGGSGAGIVRQRYYPYGEVRWSSGTLPTDYTFTGQRNESSFGLMDYNARYYDSALGRFIQADTIVPSPANPQSLNRYAYTLNNPLRYTDPTGHEYDERLPGGGGGGFGGGLWSSDWEWKQYIKTEYGSWEEYYARLYESIGSYSPVASGGESLFADGAEPSQENSLDARGPGPHTNKSKDWRTGEVEWSPMGENSAGGEFYGSNKTVIESDIAEEVARLKDFGSEQITILSGVHGYYNGSWAPHSEFYGEDLKLLKMYPDLCISDVSTMSSDQLRMLTGDIICAWCYSDRSQDIQNVLR